jgi:hypothetical protein
VKSGPGIAQVLSAGAVVISLLFVGLEIRQNTEAQRSQTQQALADSHQEFIMSLAGDPSLAQAWLAIWGANDDGVQVSSLDTQRAYIAMNAELRRLENVYLQSRGAAGEDVLRTYGFGGVRVYDSERFRQMWRSVSSDYDSAFARVFSEANGLH